MGPSACPPATRSPSSRMRARGRATSSLSPRSSGPACSTGSACGSRQNRCSGGSRRSRELRDARALPALPGAVEPPRRARGGPRRARGRQARSLAPPAHARPHRRARRRTARASCAAAVRLRAILGGARRVRELSRAGQALRKRRGETLGPRLDPRFRPGQARARRLPVAARFRPRAAAGKAPAQLDLRRTRGEERAEHADRPVIEARGHGEDEGLDAVVPREAEPVGRGNDRFDGRRPRVARAAELGSDYRQIRVGERREEKRLDRALEPPRHRGVVAVDPRLARGELALGEERVTRTRGAPEHAPVAEAVGLGLAAVLAQADERVLAGHQDVIRIDGRGHAAATSTRASLKHAPSEMSAWCAGQSAETVWPRSLVASHAPLSVATTPRTTASLILSGRRISPGSFQTRTRIPSWRPRARASSGCISRGGGPSGTWSPPNVDVMRRSDAGEIRASG